MRDFIKKYWFALFVLLFVACCTGYKIHSSHQKELERLHKELDKEKKERREQHIKDSVKATPEYIDSVRKSDEMYSDWENKRNNMAKKEIVGFVYDGDSIYHSCFHNVHKVHHPFMPIYTNFIDIDAGCLSFVTKHEVEERGFSECSECSEIIGAYNDYQDGELIKREDAREYVDDYY